MPTHAAPETSSAPEQQEPTLEAAGEWFPPRGGLSRAGERAAALCTRVETHRRADALSGRLDALRWEMECPPKMESSCECGGQHMEDSLYCYKCGRRRSMILPQASGPLSNRMHCTFHETNSEGSNTNPNPMEHDSGSSTNYRRRSGPYRHQPRARSKRHLRLQAGLTPHKQSHERNTVPPSTSSSCPSGNFLDRRCPLPQAPNASRLL
jgi:hypothetical protein